MQQTKWLAFKEVPVKMRTKVFNVLSHDKTILGLIKWHSPWRQYCYFPVGDTIWSDNCLVELSDFIARLNAGSKGRICQYCYVPRMACYIRFTHKKRRRSFKSGYHHSDDTLPETVRGESMIVDYNTQGKVTGIELISDDKPCQSIYKKKKRRR